MLYLNELTSVMKSNLFRNYNGGVSRETNFLFKDSIMQMKIILLFIKLFFTKARHNYDF